MPSRQDSNATNIDNVELRSPVRADGAAIASLAQATRTLEANSTYAYLLLATHFAGTCVVAHHTSTAAEESADTELPSTLVGFVAAYVLPSRPHVVFVWQVGVCATARGQGLAKRMLHHLVELPACRSVTHLEATVALSNKASHRLFAAFAREQRAACERSRGFVSFDFGALAHEEEPLISIGPLRRIA